MKPIRFGKIELDDSLNNHGGVGIDFWLVDQNECYTELASLNMEDVIKLGGWIVTYIEENKSK